MNYSDYITINPMVRSGKPCIKHTRMSVGDVLDYMASGMTISQILYDFPELTPDMLRACLQAVTPPHGGVWPDPATSAG